MQEKELHLFYEFEEGAYLFSTDAAKLQVSVIHQYLSEESYWAKNIPLEKVEKSIANALCFGVYLGENQVGFARVISDYTTIAYIGDVFILPAHRNKGLSKTLMKMMMEHPELQGLRRWILATADAHLLYTQFGFTALSKPERSMEKVNFREYPERTTE